MAQTGQKPSNGSGTAERANWLAALLAYLVTIEVAPDTLIWTSTGPPLEHADLDQNKVPGPI